VKYTEQAYTFKCDRARLLGITATPEIPAQTGVLMLVGGPQYRAGSHRQFTLLARQLAAQGYAIMRFDYRGMGDSEGEARTFEQGAEDIRAAINFFLERIPTVRHLVLWGLCDAASSALLYAHTDTRVSGLILLNPWVHTEAGAASARLKHYYLARLMQRSFWTKLLSGNIALGQSVKDLSKSAKSLAAVTRTNSVTPVNPLYGSAGYIDKMRSGLTRYQGELLILLSGNDLVAKEFIALIQQDKRWKKCCSSPKITRETIMQANHTFSSHAWRDQVANRTAQWLSSHGKINQGVT